MIIKKEADLKYVRFKLEHTYPCYLCEWVGDDNEVREEHRENEHSNYLFGLNSILEIFQLVSIA